MTRTLRSLRYSSSERPVLNLNGKTSLFLDSLRLFAATVVLLNHALTAMFSVAALGLLTLTAVAFIASLPLGVAMESMRNHWRRLFPSATGSLFSSVLRDNTTKMVEADQR